MNLQTNISTPGLFTVLLTILVFILVYIVYFFRKNKDEFTSIQRYVLSSVKLLYSILIAFLIFSPIFEQIKNKIERPILIIGIDNSESMKINEENETFVKNYLNNIKTELGDKFKIETLLFGHETIKSDSVNFSNLTSDYSNLLSEITSRYFNLNVGAAILIGDGIYNAGSNPEQKLSDIDYPIFTVGIGDTLAKIDQAIIDVTHNPNVFLGNSFPVEIELGFTEFPYTSTQVSIYLDGKLIKSENIEVLQPNFYYYNTYSITANKVGLNNVSVVLSAITSEVNKKNNYFNFIIEVHDNRKEILILSQGPHPDIGVITETLKKQANFNITSKNVNQFNGNLKDFDLVVLNQLPSLMSQSLSLFDEIRENKIPVLIIVGPKTSIAALNNLNLQFSLKPSVLSEESSPYFNETFSLFSMPPKIKEIENIYPPLLTHFTEYSNSSSYSVLAYQKIKGIEMNNPLIMTGDIENRKVGIVMGEGIWRWKMREYQNFDNQTNFNHLLVNLFNYLCMKDDREQLKIHYNRIVSENTSVKIKAQLFNEIYEPVDNKEIKFVLKDSTGGELRYLFDTNETEYNLDLGFLASGNYSFEASTKLGEKEFVKLGQFSVQEINVEHQNLQANFRLLNILSAETGGGFYVKGNSNELLLKLIKAENIKSKVYEEKNIHELIDWKWYVLLILLLLFLEWFLRKFWGSY